MDIYKIIILMWNLVNVVMVYQTGADCSRDDIRECLDGVFLYSRSRTFPDIMELAANFDHDAPNLRAYCRSLKDAEECIEDEVDECSDEHQMALEALNEARSILCEAGNSEMRCVFRGWDETTRDCREIYSEKMRRNSPSHACSTFNNYIECVVDAVDDECDREDRDKLEEILRAYVTPQTQTQYGCSMQQTGDSTGLSNVLIVVIVVAVILVLIIVIIAVHLCTKKDKSEKLDPENPTGGSRARGQHTYPPPEAPQDRVENVYDNTVMEDNAVYEGVPNDEYATIQHGPREASAPPALDEGESDYSRVQRELKEENRGRLYPRLSRMWSLFKRDGQGS